MRKRQLTPAGSQSSIILKSLPSVILIIATLLTMANLPLPFAQASNPFFAISAIFFLSLWQPRFLSIWVVFAAGLLYDCLQTTPLGTYALLFLLMRWITCKMRSSTGFIAKPLAAWWRFSLAAAIFFGCEWSFASTLLEQNILSIGLIWRDFFTILTYPIIHTIISSIIASAQHKF